MLLRDVMSAPVLGRMHPITLRHPKATVARPDRRKSHRNLLQESTARTRKCLHAQSRAMPEPADCVQKRVLSREGIFPRRHVAVCPGYWQYAELRDPIPDQLPEKHCHTCTGYQRSHASTRVPTLALPGLRQSPALPHRSWSLLIGSPGSQVDWVPSWFSVSYWIGLR